jgi:hypothetical protein
MANVDSQVIEKFLDHKNQRSPVISREVIWCTDDNGSTYNGDITFNLMALGNSQKWLSYQEAYIEIPYVVSMQSSADITALMTDTVGRKLVTPKDGFYQIIDSIAVEMNGRTVHQAQNFTNVHTHFKIAASADNDYITKNSSSAGFYMDDIYNKSYSTATNAQYPNATYFNNSHTSRVGVRNTEIISTGNLNALNSSNLDAVKKAGASFYGADAVAGAGRTYHWVIMAVVRLSDITDFFDQLPLCKTTDIRMIIKYNSSSIDVTTDGDAKITASTVTQNSGHTCPFMITPSGDTLISTTMSFKSNVDKTSFPHPGQSLTACRFYVPVYDVSAASTLKMLQMHPKTMIHYNDIYTYQINNKLAGADVVETISTGLTNAKYLVCIPFVHTAPPQWQNPYDTAPGTSSNIVLDNFQVQLAGKNMFKADMRYDFAVWQDELSKIFALDANNNRSMNSGLITQFLFQNAYRYYVCDLSRRDQSQDNVAKSIIVSFKNSGAVPITCLLFVAYERSVSIDTATGIISE